jgi:hypothetical protein
MVLTVSGGRELTAGSKAVGHETFEKHGVQVGTAEINGGGVSRRP